MIASCGIGVAMGTGPETLKTLARLTIGSNDDDSLAELLMVLAEGAGGTLR